MCNRAIWEEDAPLGFHCRFKNRVELMKPKKESMVFSSQIGEAGSHDKLGEALRG